MMGSGWASVWQSIRNGSKKVADFQARLFLGIAYFVVVAPFALLVRATSDPLELKPGSKRGWRARPDLPLPDAPLPDAALAVLEWARRQS
jgi:hypothetical protein